MVATRTGAKDDTYREAHNKKHPPKFTLHRHLKKCARLRAQEAAPAAAAAAAAAAPQETHCVSPAQNMPQLRRETWEVLIGSDVSLVEWYKKMINEKTMRIYSCHRSIEHSSDQDYISWRAKEIKDHEQAIDKLYRQLGDLSLAWTPQYAKTASDDGWGRRVAGGGGGDWAGGPLRR